MEPDTTFPSTAQLLHRQGHASAFPTEYEGTQNFHLQTMAFETYMELLQTPFPRTGNSKAVKDVNVKVEGARVPQSPCGADPACPPFQDC